MIDSWPRVFWSETKNDHGIPVESPPNLCEGRGARSSSRRGVRAVCRYGVLEMVASTLRAGALALVSYATDDTNTADDDILRFVVLAPMGSGSRCLA